MRPRKGGRPFAAAWEVLVVLVEVVVVVAVVDVAGGDAGAWTLFSVSRTTESRGAPPLPRPPIRYPESPTVAAGNVRECKARA